MRRRTIGALIGMCILTAFAPSPASSQLRPLEPIHWAAFTTRQNVHASLGIGVLTDQRASLAGTRGRLAEIGIYSVSWRTGRITLTASGIARLHLRVDSVERAPHPGVSGPPSDAGPAQVETVVRISQETAPLAIALRFGARLPTTSLESGLDRDATDFFSTVGFRIQRARAFAAFEAGIGINGMPAPVPDQNDVLVFSAGAGYERRNIEASAWLVGQDGLRDWQPRGSEDLSELRVGLRTNGNHWIGVQWVHGFSEWSPGDGVRVTAGLRADVTHLPF